MIIIVLGLNLVLNFAKVVYVAPTGSDAASGDIASPFQSIGRAIQESNSTITNLTILVNDGVYREFLSFHATIPVTLKAINPGNVTIRCSKPVSGFTQVAGQSYYSASLSSWTTNDFYVTSDQGQQVLKPSINFVVSSNSMGSPYLLDPSLRLHLARAPNFKVVTNWKYVEYWWRPDQPVGDWMVDITNDSSSDRTTPSDIEPGNLATLGNISNAQVWITSGRATGGGLFYRQIDGQDQATGAVSLGCSFSPCSPFPPGTLTNQSKYFVENSLSLLDAPGEYWVDIPNRIIYLIPFSSVMSTTTVVEVGYRPVGADFSAASNVLVDGMNFEMCEQNAISIVHPSLTTLGPSSDNIVLRNITVQLSYAGVKVQQPMNLFNQTIAGFQLLDSEIHDIDSYGLKLTNDFGDCFSCRTPNLHNATIRNNLFYNLGFRTQDLSDLSTGVIINNPHKLRFENNLVSNVALNGLAVSTNVPTLSPPSVWNRDNLFFGEVLIKDNIFEWPSMASAQGSAMIVLGKDAYDTFIMGNVFRNAIGWSIAQFYSNILDTSPFYVLNRGGTASAMQVQSGAAYVFQNIAYDSMECFVWVADPSAPLYFQNNLAANCYLNTLIFWNTSLGTAFSETSLFNNMMLGAQFHGMLLSTANVGNPPNFTMGRQLWANCGWDQRGILTTRAGIFDTFTEAWQWWTSSSTSTLQGFAATYPQFVNGDYTSDSFVVWNQTLDAPTATDVSTLSDSSLYNFITYRDWTQFYPTLNSSSRDYGLPIPNEITRLLTLFNIPSPIAGATIDVGPLEFQRIYRKGYSYPRGTASCQLDSLLAPVYMNGPSCPSVLQHGQICLPSCATGSVAIRTLTEVQCWNGSLMFLDDIYNTHHFLPANFENIPALCVPAEPTARVVPNTSYVMSTRTYNGTPITGWNYFDMYFSGTVLQNVTFNNGDYIVNGGAGPYLPNMLAEIPPFPVMTAHHITFQLTPTVPTEYRIWWGVETSGGVTIQTVYALNRAWQYNWLSPLSWQGAWRGGQAYMTSWSLLPAVYDFSIFTYSPAGAPPQLFAITQVEHPPTSSPTLAPTISPTMGPTITPPTMTPTVAPTVLSTTDLVVVTNPPTTQSGGVNDLESSPPPPSGQGVVRVVLELDGNQTITAALGRALAEKVLATIYQQLGINNITLNSPKVTVLITNATQTSKPTIVVVIEGNQNVIQGISTVLTQQNGGGIDLGNGYKISGVYVRWPSITNLFAGLPKVALISILSGLGLIIFLVVLAHFRARDWKGLLSLSNVVFTVFSFALCLWFFTVLKSASTTQNNAVYQSTTNVHVTTNDGSAFVPYFIAFGVSLFLTPLLNATALLFQWKRILRRDPNLSMWANVHPNFIAITMFFALFSISNVFVITAPVFGGLTAPMTPQSRLAFSALGLFGGIFELPRLAIQFVLIGLYPGQNTAAAAWLPLLLGTLSFFFTLLQRCYSLGYLRGRGNTVAAKSELALQGIR